MEFDHLPIGTPHDIQTVLKEEQKAFLVANNELMEQRLLFEEENNDLRFFLGDDEDMVTLNVSGTIMATKRSTLGCARILPSQSSLTTHSGHRKIKRHQQSSGVVRKLPSGSQQLRGCLIMLVLPS